ncbi:MAG: hypothetical protein MJE77_14420 [Proteobacteria bacterium]|nr:hypothetical protein [Pseudomonadota bacterium]
MRRVVHTEQPGGRLLDRPHDPAMLYPCTLRLLRALTASLVVSTASGAHGEPAPGANGRPDIRSDAPEAGVSGPSAELRPTVLSGLAAVVPGVIVHGTGHRIAGDRHAANRLLAVEFVALGIAGIAGAVVVASGASRKLSPPAIPFLVGGAGTFLMNWASDIYGATGGLRIGGEPDLDPALFEARLGYLRIQDPQFAYDHFTDLDVALWAGAWRIAGSAQLAVDTDNQRVELSASHRFAGPRPGRTATTGSALDLRGALVYHRYDGDDFAVATAELAIAGRYDLAGFSSTLRGSFAEMEVGLGVERIDYQVSGAPADYSHLLLMRFGYGIYVGRASGRVHGQVQIFYDHRRDDFAGGLAVPDGSNGFAGSFGIDAFAYWSRHWGTALVLEAGSSYIGGASLLYRL